MQRAGDRLRVRVQLTDVADGCQAWSERFDRAAGDVFAVEDEIAQAVVSVLNTDPLVDDLRGDPRFQALLDRLGLPRFERSFR